MRISDWSSDVCSSDLNGQPGRSASRPRAFRRQAACLPQDVPHPRIVRECGAALPDALDRTIGGIVGRVRTTPAFERLTLARVAFARLHAQHPVLRGLTDCGWRSEEHTSELQSLMRISYAV